MTLVTQAEYARYRKVSREAVRKMLATGRIPGYAPDGRLLTPGERGAMIDPVTAEASLSSATNQQRFNYSAPEPARKPAMAEPDISASNASANVARSRAAREAMQAKLLQIELETRRGSLLPKEAVLLSFEEGGRTIRRALDALPTFAGEIASAAVSGGEVAVRRLLKEQIRKLEDTIARALVLRTDADIPADYGHSA